MAATSTPVNTVSRDNLFVLIRNNVMNNSIEFASDTDVMETESPVRKAKNLQPIIKKLFHSPISPQSPEQKIMRSKAERSRKRKRKEILLPDSDDRITMAYVKEREREVYSPDAYGGMRKRVLISLFHNKEYSMDVE